MSIRVAAVQAAPIHLDLNRSLQKALALIAEAAALGAKLIVFGEAFLPGYPAWLDCCRDVALWDHEPVKKVFARLRENSVVVPSETIDAIGRTARDHGVVVNIGAHERVMEGAGRGTLYNTMLTFGADGALLNKHRKIMPTHSERMIWGQATARV